MKVHICKYIESQMIMQTHMFAWQHICTQAKTNANILYTNGGTQAYTYKNILAHICIYYRKHRHMCAQIHWHTYSQSYIKLHMRDCTNTWYMHVYCLIHTINLTHTLIITHSIINYERMHTDTSTHISYIESYLRTQITQIHKHVLMRKISFVGQHTEIYTKHTHKTYTKLKATRCEWIDTNTWIHTHRYWNEINFKLR